MPEARPLSSERCSVRSQIVAEPALATASTVADWLLLEHPGPWGFQALRDARLPHGVGPSLAAHEREHGIRTLLIRRYDRASHPSGLSCFAVHSGPDEIRIEHRRLERLDDVLGLDLTPSRGGGRPGWTVEHEPLFAVCTHGRRDPCCAERGRPLVKALHAELGNRVWETSHIGGDRFAGNLLVFPHGMYFGRLGPDRGVAVARAYAEGQVDLDHYRGRSCFPMDVQAAEHFLRARSLQHGVDEVVPEEVARDAGTTTVTLGTPRHRYRVHLRRGLGLARRLTCHALQEDRPPTYALLRIEQLA